MAFVAQKGQLFRQLNPFFSVQVQESFLAGGRVANFSVVKGSPVNK